jgi:hypothetical protein
MMGVLGMSTMTWLELMASVEVLEQGLAQGLVLRQGMEVAVLVLLPLQVQVPQVLQLGVVLGASPTLLRRVLQQLCGVFAGL